MLVLVKRVGLTVKALGWTSPGSLRAATNRANPGFRFPDQFPVQFPLLLLVSRQKWSSTCPWIPKIPCGPRRWLSKRKRHERFFFHRKRYLVYHSTFINDGYFISLDKSQFQCEWCWPYLFAKHVKNFSTIVENAKDWSKCVLVFFIIFCFWIWNWLVLEHEMATVLLNFNPFLNWKNSNLCNYLMRRTWQI